MSKQSNVVMKREKFKHTVTLVHKNHMASPQKYTTRLGRAQRPWESGPQERKAQDTLLRNIPDVLWEILVSNSDIPIH